MKSKALSVSARGTAALISAASLAGWAMAGDTPSLPHHLGGLINDYTPASVSGGPYEMRGKWSVEVNGSSGMASFEAFLNMETSDWGISKGIVDPNDPSTRSAHTHHITVSTGTVSTDWSSCPTFHPPVTGGFVVTGPASIAGNGSPASFEKSGTSTVTICITGGSQVTYSNITLVFAGPATGHFGTQAIHGVVRCEGDGCGDPE